MRLSRPFASRRRFRRYLREGPTASPAGEPASAGKRERDAARRPRGESRRRFLELLVGDRGLLLAALAVLSAATLLKLVPPAVVKLAIDNVFLGDATPEGLPSWTPIPTDPKSRLIALVSVAWGVAIVALIAGTWGQWWALLVSRRLTSRMRRRAFEHASRLPLNRVHEMRAAGASSLLREDVRCAGELVFSLIFEPCRAAVQIAGGVLMMAWVDWRLLVATATLLPLIYGTGKLGDRLLRPLYRDNRRLRREVDAATAEVFGGMRVVRAFGRPRLEALRFVTGNNLLLRMEIHAWRWSRFIEVVWRILLPTATGALMLYGGFRILEGRLSPGEMMMFLVYLALLAGPLSTLAAGLERMQSDLSAFDRILDLLDEPCELSPPVGAPIKVSKRTTRGRLTLEGVSFRYPGQEEYVLAGVDLDVEPGEVVALVGPSGAGKTTLCNLIARFHDPTEGSIRLDGVDLRDIHVDSYRRLLGIVEQDVYLFEGTVGENIAYADRRVGPEAVVRAAISAHADEFIREFPQGYDTLIGERGVRLSGGQRQRLAIARAILADPRIFILDEATSNLDGRRERLIQQGLETLMIGRTSLIIAHRLSTIRKADRILVLERGRIVEQGSHSELISIGGSYRGMVELQSIESDA